jgi:hypothetical protein
MAKFNEETINKILIAHENGLNQRDSAIFADIDESTLYRWIEKGKKAKRGKYRKFYDDFRKAQIKNKVYHLKKIQDDDSWQSSAWYLERKYKKEYGKYDMVDLNHNGQVELKNELSFDERIKAYEDYFTEVEQERQSINSE